MGLHPYCITPADHAPVGTGIDDAPLHACIAGSLAAWASPHEAPPHASIEAVRAHDAVIRRAMDQRVTPVPLRFGQWAASEQVLRERIEEHAAAWTQRLAELAGSVEMGLRFTPLAPAAPGPEEPAGAEARTSGRAYMQQLAARVHAREADEQAHARLLALVERELGALAQRTASGAPQDDRRALWVAHLVRRERTGEYRLLADRIADQVREFRTAVTGPWPPYSFVP